MVRWGRYLLALVVVSVVAVVLRMDPNQLTHRVPQPRQAVLLFAGDVMQHTPQIEAARRGVAYHYESVFESVHPYFSSADIAVVNLETTLSEEPPYTGYPLFRAPAALAHALARCGVDVACLANNHALDWGAEGVRRTARILDREGMRRVGVYRDSTDFARHNILRLESRGLRFALMNYTYSTNGMPVPQGMVINRIDTLRMARDLAAVADVDCRIVCIHWGNEYERRPNVEQRRLAAFLRRNGADVIIGHHPHVIQPYVADSSHLCFYSLGNFVSNQRKRYCDGGLMVRVTVTSLPDGRLDLRAEAIPVWVDKRAGYRVVPLVDHDSVVRNDACELFRRDTRILLSEGL